MAKEIRRRIPLDGETDLLDVRILVEKGRVVGFVLNYAAVIRGEERVVCRYDTCHGHLHVHRYWLRGGAPQDLEPPGRAAPDYARMAGAAEADLAHNWRAYRAKMELMR